MNVNRTSHTFNWNINFVESKEFDSAFQALSVNNKFDTDIKWHDPFCRCIPLGLRWLISAEHVTLIHTWRPLAQRLSPFEISMKAGYLETKMINWQEYVTCLQ